MVEISEESHFLLAGPDTASQVGSGYLAESDAGDGGGPGRSRLVALGVVDATRRPSEVGHKEFAERSRFSRARSYGMKPISAREVLQNEADFPSEVGECESFATLRNRCEVGKITARSASTTPPSAAPRASSNPVGAVVARAGEGDPRSSIIREPGMGMGAGSVV